MRITAVVEVPRVELGSPACKADTLATMLYPHKYKTLTFLLVLFQLSYFQKLEKQDSNLQQRV